MSYLWSQPSTRDDYIEEVENYLVDTREQCMACNDDCIEIEYADDAQEVNGDMEWICYDVECPKCGDISNYGNMDV